VSEKRIIETPERCPRCRAWRVVPIVYGHPSRELEEASWRGEVVLGGCLVPMPQKWACRVCGYRWPLPDEVLRSELVASALEFMYQAHQGQRRKGDDAAYEEHPIEVAQTLYEADFPAEVVAAGLLHDVLEDTDHTVAELVARFGGRVAGLVDALTDDRSIDDYNKRKAAHRARIRHIGLPAAAIYAADKLANLRSLRAAYRAQGEAVGERFNASLDVKVEHCREDVEILRRFADGISFLQELELELLRLRADRLTRGEGP